MLFPQLGLRPNKTINYEIIRQEKVTPKGEELRSGEWSTAKGWRRTPGPEGGGPGSQGLKKHDDK